MVDDSEDSEADHGEILVTSDHFRPKLIGLHFCVVTAHAQHNYRHTHQSKPVLPAVYTYTEMRLKTEI